MNLQFDLSIMTRKEAFAAINLLWEELPPPYPASCYNIHVPNLLQILERITDRETENNTRKVI
jgi:hypothetical protein